MLGLNMLEHVTGDRVDDLKVAFVVYDMHHPGLKLIPFGALVIDRTYAVGRRLGGQALRSGGGGSPSLITSNCQRSLTEPKLSSAERRIICNTTKVSKTRPMWRTIA